MKNAADTPSRLNDIMDAAVLRNPHAKDIITAFRPLILERNRLVDTVVLKGADSFTLDESLFKEGVSLIRQNVFFHPDDPYESISISLISAFQEGFPNLIDEWKKMEESIKVTSNLLYDFFQSYPQEGTAFIDQWASRIDTDTQHVGFLFRQVARVILEKRARDLADLIKDFDWEKGYCPVCGAHPVIAKNQEGTGQRWLLCSQCSHEWRFSRVICPYCENRDQKTMTYFHIENKEQESTFACEKCRRYLITLNRVGDLADFDADIAALSLAHLDIIMQDKGFEPMALGEWGAFS